ncbi:MAG TPA: DNA replication/repair protein RecF [Gammaproteobacteria bacterium]|nr:DNA replication/repair protein RecF [Gammaproteobacteria bacterium]
MPLSRVRITTLRCLREVDLELHPRRNYLFGPNGAGKTSLLEGVFVLGRGRSFRTRQMRRLVQHGADGFAVFGEADVNGLGRRLGVAYRAGRLEKKIDGQPAIGMAQLASLLPVHAVDPSMHAIVEGGPSERRRFLDWGVFHVEPGYLEAWKGYRRVLSQRNAALKRAAAIPELRPWSAALADAGAAIDDSRRRYLGRLAPFVMDFGQRLLDRPLSLDYRRGWAAEQELADALAAGEARDRQNGSTDAGPHRAEIVLRLDERRVQDEASRGQQKLTAAALILSQVAVESAERPQRSVVLVDDPAAELDAQSLDRLLAAINALPAQLVFTALTPEHLVPDAAYPTFHVERGGVRKL